MSDASGDEDASGSENIKSDEKSAPPLDAKAWRAVFKTIPPRDLWGVLQKDKPTQAQIFAGFRPAPEMLRSHPVVVNRLVDTAVKQPAFAQNVRELLPEMGETETSPPAEETVSVAEAVAEPALVSQIAVSPPLPVASAAKKNVEPKTDDKSREKINALRDAARQQSARIAELTQALTQAEQERDATRKEAVVQNAALLSAQESTRRAEAEVRREKRIRERDLQKAEATAQAKAEKAAQKAASATATAAPVSAAWEETLLYAAAQRLLQAGRAQTIADLCKQALLVDAPNASQTERGRVHALYAQALYGMGDGSNGAREDRFAAAAFLDGGQAARAAEALSRLAAHSPTGFRASDAPLLKRAAALAQKTNQTEAVQTVFKRLRITAPSAYLTLRGVFGNGVSSGQAVLSVLLGDGASGSRATIGPDEPVTLPHAPGFGLAAITPRRLVRAVNSGDAPIVSAVRAALYVLREQDDKAANQLADAFLDSVAQLSPIAASPLLYETTRPIIVDASNVARYNADPLSLQTAPRVLHLKLMRDYLLRRGYFPVSLIADANLRYHVDDRPAYLELIENHIVRETPPGTSADEVLLQEARAHSTPLVTNDRFSDWGEAARQVERIGFLVSASGASLTSF